MEGRLYLDLPSCTCLTTATSISTIFWSNHSLRGILEGEKKRTARLEKDEIERGPTGGLFVLVMTYT